MYVKANKRQSEICTKGTGVRGERAFLEKKRWLHMIFKMGEKVMGLGDINAQIGNECTEGMIDSFGVPRDDENGECLIDKCAA